jgi:hypothetical protein
VSCNHDDTKKNMSVFSSLELSSCHSDNTQYILGLTILSCKEQSNILRSIAVAQDLVRLARVVQRIQNTIN